jgi:transcriptional regulator with XRE-family HTH domain
MTKFEQDPLAAVARILQKMRQARDWSPDDLAQRAGVPVDTIHAYEAKPANLSEHTGLQVFEAIPLHPDDRTIFRDTLLITDPHPLITRMQSRLYELEAAVCIDERDFVGALDKLDFILVLRPGPAQVGRVQLSRGTVLGEMGRIQRALEALQAAEDCLDRVHEPHLWLRLRMEQLYILCQTERFRDAEPRLAETQKLAARAGSDRQRLQVRRLAGWIASGLDRTEEAVHVLRPVCAEMIATGLVFEGGCVALELAGLLIAQGKTAEAAEVARQVEPLKEEKRLSHDARTTLKVFGFTVRRGTFTVEMSRQLSGEFRKAGTRVTRPYELPE